MRSFEPGFLDRLVISHELLLTIGALREFRGREALFRQQMPQVLDTMVQVAVIQSTEASNRIEGIVAPPKRIRDLVALKTTPRNRSEQEIAGYREALAMIHASHADMPFTPSLVLQLHRDLYRFSATEGGRWKPVDNEISEIDLAGNRTTRFTPVAAFAVSDYMECLHAALSRDWEAGNVDRLILTAGYSLDFLCIHPFLDGNGRMARLLTLLLLYRAGFEVGRYISLERIVEESRESYYAALLKSSQGWHEGEHDLRPWLEYFLGVLLAAYRQFEERVHLISSPRGAKTEMVRQAVQRLPERFRMAEMERLCPHVTRDMIRVVLRGLKANGELTQEGKGPGAVWRKSSGNTT